MDESVCVKVKLVCDTVAEHLSTTSCKVITAFLHLATSATSVVNTYPAIELSLLAYIAILAVTVPLVFALVTAAFLIELCCLLLLQQY